MNKQVTIFIRKYSFCLLHQTWQNFCEKIFLNDYFKQLFYASLTKLIGQTLLTNIYIYFFFLAWVGLVQALKRVNIGYRELLNKNLGWFLGFRSKGKSIFWPKTAPANGQSSPQKLQVGLKPGCTLQWRLYLINIS